MFLLVTEAWAASPDAPEVAVPHVDAGAIVVDGRLDEPAWANAAVVDVFTRWQPTAGGPTPGATVARIAQDDRRLYLAFTCDDPEPSRVRAHVTPREDVNFDDQVGITLDTFGDGRSGYIFWISALGVQQDIRYAQATGWSMEWDTVWASKGQRTPTGYQLEIAIPWKSLRYPKQDAQRWGVILERKIAAEGAYYAWPAVPNTLTNRLEGAAWLGDLTPPHDRGRLWVTPTLVTGVAAQRATPADRLDVAPYDGALAPIDPVLGAFDPGLTVSWGPTPSASVDLVANPDFSQVEADPYYLDLNTRFAIQLTERRPFFLEGVDTWGDPAKSLYSRSIADPAWGARFTGRFGDAQLGLMHVYDQAPKPSFARETDTPGFEDTTGAGALIEVARAKVDLGDRLQLGAIGLSKDLVDAKTLEARAANRVAGVDLTGTLSERWTLATQLRGSTTSGGDGALLGSATSLSVARGGNTGWGGSLSLNDVSAGFRDENGYVPRPGLTSVGFAPRYRFEPENGAQYLQPSVQAYVAVDRLPETPIEHWVGPELEARLLGNTEVWTGFGHGQENYQAQPFAYWQGWFGASAAPNTWLDAYVEASVGQTTDYDDVSLAANGNFSAGATVRPVANAKLELSWDHETLLDTDLSAVRYDLDLLRAELNVQFTRATGLRGIVQWRDVEQALFANVLFTVMPSPGTAFYLGYGEQAVTGVGGGAIDRRVFAKVSGQLRL